MLTKLYIENISHIWVYIHSESWDFLKVLMDLIRTNVLKNVVKNANK